MNDPMNDPDAIREDIERTRAELSNNVNALADNANPANVARRQVDKVREGASDLKARVFGDPEDPWDEGAVGSARGRVTDAVGDARGQVSHAVQTAPATVRRTTRGNPLAAGLIAFGLGALVGGLVPGSDAEKQAARSVKDKAQPLVDEARNVAREVADNLQPLAQDAVAQVKDAAASATENVKADARVARDEAASRVGGQPSQQF